MSITEFLEQETIRLQKVDQQGHYHNCPKCKQDHYCPGIQLGFHCRERLESKCPRCMLHPKTFEAYNKDKTILCFDCGADIDWSKWETLPTEEEKERWFYSGNGTICDSCFEKGRANGSIHTVEEFFDNHTIGIKDEEGKIVPVKIKDQLDQTIN